METKPQGSLEHSNWVGYSMGRCGAMSWKMERNEAFLKDKSFSWDVLDCKEKLPGSKSEQNVETVSSRLQVFPKNMAPTASIGRPQKLQCR